MTTTELNQLKAKFESEVGVWLYQALEIFFGCYNPECYCFDDDSALRINSDNLRKTINELKALCLQKKASKEINEAKLLEEFTQASLEKSLNPKTARGSWIYVALRPFIDEATIKENLCKNPTICWNPVCLQLCPDENCVCIFTPSQRLISKYSFIKKCYTGESRKLNYYYIDAKELSKYRSWDLEIQDSDIIQLNYRYLHPRCRGIIQASPDFTWLINTKNVLLK